ncbi:MAG: sulfatase [Phycisphaerae bacterium]
MSDSQRSFRRLAAIVVLAVVAVLIAGALVWGGRAVPQQVASSGGASAHSRSGEVNIVIFLIDTLRADRLGVYGYERRPTSPRTDALADESVVFEQAYAPSPWTLPTLVSLLTSTFPCEHNVLHNRHRLGDSFDPLAVRLKPLGYTTISLYANPFASPRFGLGRGYDVIVDLNRAQSDGQTVAAALDGCPTAPFFLYLHNTEPHNPYDYAPPHTDGFRDIPAQTRKWFDKQNTAYRRLSRVDFANKRSLGTTDNTAEQDRVLAALRSKLDDYRELYDAAVRAADRRLGSVIDVLKSRKLWDNTLFIILADHGEEMAERGGWLHDQSVYEELMRVPLIVRFPRGEYGGHRLRSVVSLVDVLPTIIDYLQEPELLHGTRGRSLMPLVRGEQPDEDRNFKIPGMRMNRKKYYRPWKESRGDTNLVVRRGDWKGIWNAEIDTFELYDLPNDPQEQHDVSAEHTELVSAMLRAARSWYEDCGSRAAETEEAPQQIDEQTLRSLRSLGYID